MKFMPIKLIALMISLLLVACHQQESTLQGYMDADYTYISSNFSGNLLQLTVKRGQNITKGQLLFILDAQPEISQLNNAEAKVSQAVAQVKKQQIELSYQASLLARYQKLIKTTGISREDFESVRNNYQNAEATLQSLRADLQGSLAELEKAKWSRSNKIANSPLSGYVYDTYYTLGELVPATKPVLSLLSPDNLKVVFYIAEPLLSKIRLNQEVKIDCDNCKTPFSGKISFISSKTEYTPPNIYSEDNLTKFIYRIEARPERSAFMQLHPGQPVSVNLLKG